MHKLENLKLTREQNGLLQKDVAAIIGVNRTTYVKYENGDSEPPFEIMKKLANFFHVSIDYLLGLTDNPNFSGGPLAAFIKNRRGNEAEESFAEKCGISVDLLRRIESGFRKLDEGNKANQQNSLSTHDLETLANGLNAGVENGEKVDFWYLACLYDGINPHNVKGLSIPSDDRTRSFPRLLDIKLDLFGETKSAPSVSDEAMMLAKDFDALDAWGRKQVRNVTDTELARSKAYQLEMQPAAGTLLDVKIDLFSATKDERITDDERILLHTYRDASPEDRAIIDNIVQRYTHAAETSRFA